MITVNDGFAGGPVAFVKGAPEVVLPRCSVVAGSPTPLDSAARTVELERAAAAAAQGARVLALARGRTPPMDAAEGDLLFVGLVALRDPVRPEAADAVREAGAAGVRVLMVTGDHPGTASAVAAMVGLDAGPPVTGVDLRRDGIPSDPLSHRVYARVDPREKLALVEALQADGHVVAVTGDGVNDAPALRRADIGAAMGRSGSDVAREAADLVVTDDDLATIVAAIREGRGIYDNIRKVVDYLVAGNLSEIMVVVAGLLAFPALGVPLLPLQLLWINLLTDGLPAIAFGVDPPDPGLMRRPPRPRSSRLLDAVALRMLGGRAALVAGAAVGSLAVARFVFGEPWEHARAVMFSVLVGAHLLYAFAARWPRGGRSRRRAGVWLVAAVTAGLGLQVAVVTLEPLRHIFGAAPLTLREWALVAVGATAPLAVMALAATGRPAERLGAVLP